MSLLLIVVISATASSAAAVLTCSSNALFRCARYVPVPSLTCRVLSRFMKHYSPVAATKATAAALVMVETAKHVLTA